MPSRSSTRPKTPSPSACGDSANGPKPCSYRSIAPSSEWDRDPYGSPREEEDAAAAGPPDPDPELDKPAYTHKHRFRIVPIREVINPLLKAMAHTIRRLPRLSDFSGSTRTTGLRTVSSTSPTGVTGVET
ncbi:hypothetical protein N657DRAFT_640477 [Parathielavia appendiculata]|uniref:Uncharacterized protein n=1 Tax=Parathielavia appendiculata TaxID=2587402 RepID=A0AAN6UBR3_9PEZI|nr:hypothetical protein N657DRAFT_640477 [Parathielavia appendiculata]